MFFPSSFYAAEPVLAPMLPKRKADFVSKMSIALKEANETHYWLKLLYRTEYLSKTQFDSLDRDVQELIGLLTAICKTANKNK